MEINGLLAAAVAIYFGLVLFAIERRQVRIEQRLLMLSRQLGLVDAAGSEPSERVQRLLADRGRYVEALKAYREETGADLKEARRVIDPLRASAREASSV
jgi:ribosomal protein L7/L12